MGCGFAALSARGSRGVRGFRHHVVIAVRHRRRLGEPAPNVTGARPAIIRTVRPIISVSNLTKTYASGLQALRRIDLQIRKGEIFALLGPNGAGKTTLISIVCGIVTPTEGTVLVDGQDIVRDYRAARSTIGLVPQELSIYAFESVWSNVNFSRGLFGRAPNPAFVEKLLRDLSLWDKRKDRIMTLSGGMWALVRGLRQAGVTIILTTHYINEAEEMADRIGVINKGELILVENKTELMKKLGKKQLTLHLQQPMAVIPAALADWSLALKDGGREIEYRFDSVEQDTGVPALLKRMSELGIAVHDLNTRQSSLEEIFVSLVSERAGARP